MPKKKILFINNHFQYSDGTVRSLINLVNNLDLDKFDVTILPLYRCDQRLAAELKPGIKLCKAFGFYVRGLTRIVRMLPMRWLYQRWIGGKYDIEIAFQCDVPTLLACYSCNQQAVHVAWMHGYQCYDCYDRLDKVVCVSKYCADKTREEMGGCVDVTYRYNLVDENPILTMANEPIEVALPAYPILVTVGRFSPEKGYVRLVKILDELRHEGIEFHLLLVGDGPQMKEIRNEIALRKMQDRITLTGAQTNPHKYTAKADIFICSSFSEGYSTACTEAALLCVPIITTCVPGGAEIIEDCECGLLTELDDESLKSAIRSVLVSPELLTQWKETMKRTFQKFTLSPRMAGMDLLFDELYELSEKKRSNTANYFHL